MMVIENIIIIIIEKHSFIVAPLSASPGQGLVGHASQADPFRQRPVPSATFFAVQVDDSIRPELNIVYNKHENERLLSEFLTSPILPIYKMDVYIYIYSNSTCVMYRSFHSFVSSVVSPARRPSN